MPKKNPNGWIQTYSGIRVFPLEPDLDTILLPDIAHSLAYQCRFGGHIRNYYSVAQHSILVSKLAEKFKEPVLICLAGLLHDATETYLIDLPRPVKMQIPEYKEIEGHLILTISKRFELDLELFEKVKKYDDVALTIEAEKLLAPLLPEWKTSGVQKMDSYNSFELLEETYNPEKAEKEFINRFNLLWARRKLEGV